MNNFNADKAKKIVNSIYTDELHNILVDIHKEANKGETVLHIYKNISHKTRQELLTRGFKVFDHPSIAIQKDGLYYSIYWK